MEVFNNIKKQFDVSQIINKDNTNNSNRDLEEVAQEFESLFINEMLKRAHSAKLAKTILTSDTEDTYTSLLNQERSKILAQNHNFGTRERTHLIQRILSTERGAEPPQNLCRRSG